MYMLLFPFALYNVVISTLAALYVVHEFLLASAHFL